MTDEERLTSLESRVAKLEEIVASYENAFVSNLKYQQTTLTLRADDGEAREDIDDLLDRVAALEA